MLVAGFLLLMLARSLLSSRGWHLEMGQFSGFITHTMPCQPKGLEIQIYRLLTSQAYAKMLI